MIDAGAAPLLEVRSLKKHFPMRKGFSRKVVGAVRAVDDVSFSIREGETLGLVGESGCGKTTTSRCILRAIDPTLTRVLGEIRTRSEAVASAPESRPMPELMPKTIAEVTVGR